MLRTTSSAVVDEYLRLRVTRAVGDPRGQVQEVARREIALTDLDEVDARFNGLIELTLQCRELCRCGARVRGHRATIRHQAQRRARKRDHGAGGMDSDAALRARMTPERSRRPATAVTRPTPVTAPRTNAFDIHIPTHGKANAK